MRPARRSATVVFPLPLPPATPTRNGVRHARAQTSRARRSGQRGSARTVARSGSPSTTDGGPEAGVGRRLEPGRRRWSTLPALAQLHATSKAVCALLGGFGGVDDLAHLGRLARSSRRSAGGSGGCRRPRGPCRRAARPAAAPQRWRRRNGPAPRWRPGSADRWARARRRPRRARRPSGHRSRGRWPPAGTGSARSAQARRQALGGRPTSPCPQRRPGEVLVTRAGILGPPSTGRRRRCRPTEVGSAPAALRRRVPPGGRAPRRSNASMSAPVLRGSDLLEVVEGQEQDEERRRRSGRWVKQPDRAGDGEDDREARAPGRCRTARRDVAAVERADRQRLSTDHQRFWKARKYDRHVEFSSRPTEEVDLLLRRRRRSPARSGPAARAGASP